MKTAIHHQLASQLPFYYQLTVQEHVLQNLLAKQIFCEKTLKINKSEINSYLSASQPVMAQLAVKRTSHQEGNVFHNNFIVIYLPSEVAINYTIHDDDIQHCFTPAHSYFIICLRRCQFEQTNIFMPAVGRTSNNGTIFS